MLEVIGPHKLYCGDLTLDAVDKVMGDERADVVYADPPWGPAHQQIFATMCARGSSPRLPWPEFLHEFCNACIAFKTLDAPVFVEMGTRWADELDAAMADVGQPRLQRWTVTYGSKTRPMPFTLSLYGPRRLLKSIAITMPEPAHGEPVTREVLRAVVKPGSVVLDPCTGLGMTARWTHTFGGHFRGTELNAARLERTAAWLRKRAA